MHRGDAWLRLQRALEDVLREATRPGRPTGWSGPELNEWTDDLMKAMDKEV